MLILVFELERYYLVWVILHLGDSFYSSLGQYIALHTIGGYFLFV